MLYQFTRSVSTPISIVSTGCGLLFIFSQIIKTAVTMQSNVSIDDIIQLYTHVIDSLKGNRQMIMTIVIFAMIIMVTYL